ncbi:unnamed protein product, partial [marine sediment metagenome]
HKIKQLYLKNAIIYESNRSLKNSSESEVQWLDHYASLFIPKSFWQGIKTASLYDDNWSKLFDFMGNSSTLLPFNIEMAPEDSLNSFLYPMKLAQEEVPAKSPPETKGKLQKFVDYLGEKGKGAGDWLMKNWDKLMMGGGALAGMPLVAL